MNMLSKIGKILIAVVILVGLGLVLVNFYSVIFSSTITGEVVGIERVDMPMTIVTRPGNDLNSKVFSFAVAIKDKNSGEIHTASAEDRQWAVVQKGQCAEAVFLPYPPWNLEKKGTFFGARLIRLYDCKN